MDKAKIIHNNKYNYELFKPNNYKDKSIIICPIHGKFIQSKYNHISRKNGCPKCGELLKINNIKFNKVKTINDFIKKSFNKHRNKYIYIYPILIKSNFILDIYCKKCKTIFKQSLKNHLNGNGCKRCGILRTKNINTYTNNDFINISNYIHNNKYNYELVNYININTIVIIICPIHGKFNQIPKNHIGKGSGCPTCSSSKGELLIQSILDKNNIKYNQQYKFKDLNKLSFDFYLQDLNICIEYDGIQHFKEVKFFGGKKQLKKQQLNDLIKDQYCDKNNIRLIRYDYKDNIKIL